MKTNNFTLTQADYDKFLKDIPKDDYPQMFAAEKFLIITDESGKRISRIRSRELIGAAHYLCALHRAAFHGTSTVEVDDIGNQVLRFDCIKFFKDKK